MKVKLFINNNDKSRDFANSLQKKLIKKGFIIAEEDYDLAIAIGGDGSFLRMVKSSLLMKTVYMLE